MLTNQWSMFLLSFKRIRDYCVPQKFIDNENSRFFAFIDQILWDSLIHINASLLFEGCFIAYLDNIYLLFLSIYGPWYALVSIFITANQTRPTKSCSICFLSFIVWKIFSHSRPYLHEINNIQKGKRKNCIGFIVRLLIDDRSISVIVSYLKKLFYQSSPKWGNCGVYK